MSHATTGANEASDQAAAAVAKTSKRITLEHIRTCIANVKFIHDDTLTICVLTLRNGWKLLHHSACVDPANYNRELGEKIAYEGAEKQIWALEGYVLATEMARG
jgi:hypothetical protein